MRSLLRLRAVLTIAVKRIFSQIGLAAAAIIGLIVAVALTMSVPVYAEAVYYRTFLESIMPSEDTLSPRPPYAFMFYYGGGLHPPVQWEATRGVDQYMNERAAPALGLP
ncbi:MAG: ABC transporter permease, partial [Anaerolineae bacterium]|nr:ABC transporter permease [Anaerolineae bacterium]